MFSSGTLCFLNWTCTPPWPGSLTEAACLPWTSMQHPHSQLFSPDPIQADREWLLLPLNLERDCWPMDNLCSTPGSPSREQDESSIAPHSDTGCVPQLAARLQPPSSAMSRVGPREVSSGQEKNIPSAKRH